MTEAFITFPLPSGRSVHDDPLGVGERAIVNYLAELPVDRLQAIVSELVDVARLAVELEIVQREGL